jgi:tape measure domain-containing protein
MAEISLKIKSDFAQAEADFKALIGTSEKLQKVNDVNSKEYKALSNQIDKYIEKNKLSTVAMTATQGKSAALTAEYKKLQTQLQTLINKGLDPMSPALDKLKSRMGEIQSYAPKASSSFSGMLSSLGALSIGFGTYQIANKIIDIGKASLTAAANMEQQQVALTTMLGSTEKATSLLADLQAFAASTPFQFEELVDASKRMIAFGFSAEEVTQKLGMIGDVSAGLSQPIGDMIYLFGQIKTQGRAMTQDLMQFANRGVPIYDELAKVLGVSTSKVKKFAEQGKIGFKEIDQVFKNLTSEGGKFAGLMDAQSQTLAGRWSNFNDTLGRSAVILGDKMAPAASEIVTLLTHIASIDVNENLKDAPQYIGGFTGLLKIINNDLDGTKDKVNTIFDGMDQDKLDQIVNEVDAWEASSTGVSAKVNDILKKYGDINGAAVLYTRYVTDDIKLTGEQVKELERILALRESIGAEAKSELESWRQRGLVAAAAKEKTDEDKKPKGDKIKTKKSEEQIFQERLNLMQNMELQSNAKRAKAAEDFFNQKMELEYQFGMDLVSWQLEQDALIENNARLTAEQKIAAHEAASKAIAERQKKDVKMYTDFGQHMLSNTGSILTDLQTVFKNAGKESKALGYMLKGVAIGEATINSYLAFTKALAAFPPPFNYVAAGITLAAGLAKVAAIASTPISAQTGLTSYEVPDIRQYRNDGAPVKAQAGETVTVTPRGESAMGVTNVSIKIGEAELFSIVQKGINTGEISITNNNIGRGVFAV